MYSVHVKGPHNLLTVPVDGHKMAPSVFRATEAQPTLTKLIGIATNLAYQCWVVVLRVIPQHTAAYQQLLHKLSHWQCCGRYAI